MNGDANLPVPIILLFFVGTFLYGFYYIPHTDKATILDIVYFRYLFLFILFTNVECFSIISFFTVGFGDKYPQASTPSDMFSILGYLIWGIVLSTSLFSHLSLYFRKVCKFYLLNNFVFTDSLLWKAIHGFAGCSHIYRWSMYIC